MLDIDPRDHMIPLMILGKMASFGIEVGLFFVTILYATKARTEVTKMPANCEKKNRSEFNTADTFSGFYKNQKE